MSEPARFPFVLEYLFSFRLLIKSPIEVIGSLPEGVRINGHIAGGEVTGNRVQGKLLAGGGDSLVLRRDGIGIADVRATIQTNDRALIYLTYTGRMDTGADGFEQFHQQTLPAKFAVRMTPHFHTSHPDYQWLTRLYCLGIGQLNNEDPNESFAAYDIYAVN